MAVHHGQRGTSTRNWTTESNWSMAQQIAMFPCCCCSFVVVHVVCYRSENEVIRIQYAFLYQENPRPSPFTTPTPGASPKQSFLDSAL